MKRILAMTFTLAVAGAAPASPQEIENVRYDVFYGVENAAAREIHVEMSFEVEGTSVVSLSFAAWTPGSYTLDDYARNVRDVSARQGDVQIDWDKSDWDTWRVYPTGSGRVTFAFDYHATAFDTGSSWTGTDFAFFNGTNVFPFPDEGTLDFASEVVFHTEPDWRVTTGMTARSDREYVADTYHELVDMPAFVGRFDLDSMRIGDVWHRLASYPEGALQGEERTLLWDQLQRMMPVLEDVTDRVPFDRYTTLLVFDGAAGGGGSALEHANSHLGLYSPAFRGTPVLASITAHEIFHAWNVKRMRPADLWPYDYTRPMPTEMLWVSEGITDYYADLALVRGGIVSSEYFLGEIQTKMDEVAGTPPVALEDASLSTWISPTDGTGYIYYSKGALAGLMLDILVRDASDNARSLDDVVRAVYEGSYLDGEGFTEEEWWAAVREAAGGRSFEQFHDAYVDGREPYPWDEVLPLAGLRLRGEGERVPRVGVTWTQDGAGVQVVAVAPGSAAADAGVQAGDRLISVAGFDVGDADWGARFRAQFEGAAEGTSYAIVVERAGARLELEGRLRFDEVVTLFLEVDPTATEKAVRIREGILRGSTAR